MLGHPLLGTVGVFISNGPIGFHADKRPVFLQAGGDKGFACVIEESHHPFGNTSNEVRAIDDILGFHLIEVDRVVVYVEHRTIRVIRNLVAAGISGERLTIVTCTHHHDEVRAMVETMFGLNRVELITDQVECGGMQMIGTLLERFRFDLCLHD